MAAGGGIGVNYSEQLPIISCNLSELSNVQNLVRIIYLMENAPISRAFHAGYACMCRADTGSMVVTAPRIKKHIGEV